LRKLKIKNTAKTPEILFNPNGKLEISGVSVPENSMGFYGGVIDWVKEYVESPADETLLVFKLAYINTSSLQFVYDILSLLSAVNKTASTVSVEWYYEEDDVDMKETGEDYDETISLPFTFIGVSEV